MKRTWAGLLALSLLVGVAPQIATAAVKAGATCAKLKSTTTVSGYKYTCIKSGKKLVWSKGTKVAATPKPTATPTPTPTPTVISTSESIDSCRIKDASNPEIGQYGGALYGGFIDKNRPVPSSGTVTWYLVPIDFIDLKGESDWRSRVDIQMKLLTEYYDTVSYGKLKIQWKVYDGWITLPGGQANYAINQSGDYISTEIFWKSTIETIDPNIDFTGVQVVNFILPKAQTAVKESAQGFPWTGDINKYNSSESKLSEFSVPGIFFEASHRTYWSYWAHEYGHTLGLPHIAGSRFASAFHPYDLMGDQDARRELSGWTRFAVTSWIEDKWVYCKSKENINSELVYITDLNSRGDGNKLIIIPVSSTKVLIAESRVKTKFVGASNIPGRTDGVFVYIYDATLGHNKEYLSLPSVTSDPILSVGESVTYEGVTIKVLETGTLDKILITR
jgi:M6 family metalloprotease-like protein